MNPKQAPIPVDGSDAKNDPDVETIPLVEPIEIEPFTIGDDVYDPRSVRERFPMPEDMPSAETQDEKRDLKS